MKHRWILSAALLMGSGPSLQAAPPEGPRGVPRQVAVCRSQRAGGVDIAVFRSADSDPNGFLVATYALQQPLGKRLIPAMLSQREGRLVVKPNDPSLREIVLSPGFGTRAEFCREPCELGPVPLECIVKGDS